MGNNNPRPSRVQPQLHPHFTALHTLQVSRSRSDTEQDFATVADLRTLALANIPYQQLDFAPATGRYVRLTFQSTYPNPDANLGFTELQLLQVPEPSRLAAVVGVGLSLLARRRRRAE